MANLVNKLKNRTFCYFSVIFVLVALEKCLDVDYSVPIPIYFHTIFPFNRPISKVMNSLISIGGVCQWGYRAERPLAHKEYYDLIDMLSIHSNLRLTLHFFHSSA